MPTKHAVFAYNLVIEKDLSLRRKVDGTMRKISEEVLRVWIKQAQQNRIEATEKIIEQFTPLLKSYAKKYSRHMHAYFEDLYQVGVVGLLHAIKKFDLTAKNPFYSYAVLCIVGMIKNHFRNCTWGIKVPASIKQNYARFRDVSEALEIQLNRRPTIDEIAKEMDITVQLAQQLFVSSIHYQSLSFDGNYNKDDESSFDEVIGREDSNFQQVECETFFQQFETILSSHEKEVIYKLFLEEWPQSRVASYLNVSQMQVSRLRKHALNKIKRMLEKEQLSYI